jgi:hypothetical protein
MQHLRGSIMVYSDARSLHTEMNFTVTIFVQYITLPKVESAQN